MLCEPVTAQAGGQGCIGISLAKEPARLLAHAAHFAAGAVFHRAVAAAPLQVLRIKPSRLPTQTLAGLHRILARKINK